MDLDIHGVIKKNLFLLSNFSLTKQLLIINLIISFFGLALLVLINFYLITNDESIDRDLNQTILNLEKINTFLENNSIARIPLFQNCRINNLIDQNCEKDNFLDEIVFSQPELEPTSAQQFIIQNFLDSNSIISVYNEGMIEIINSSTLFIGNESNSDIKELDLSDNFSSEINFKNTYLNNYNNFFNFFYSKLVRKKFTKDIILRKHEIKIFKETIKKRRVISQKFIDKENNIIHYASSPIISQNKVYGVTMISNVIQEENNELSYLSFILFNFFISFILVTILLSLFFIRGLIVPLRQLSNITLLERQKIKSKFDLEYPNRKDEIGILSNQIQDMSSDLKRQINQLEKFTADVAHELKNPLTAIKSSSELLLKNTVSEDIKIKLLKNFNNDVDRMNRLISDISNFSRIIAEIGLEDFKLVDLNKFIHSFVENYSGNFKKIKFDLDLKQGNFIILVNQDKLIQVFSNLIDNSISASAENSIILIKAKEVDSNLVVIKFYDQGVGINFEDKNKIFERFYTDRHNNRNNHSGLGLSISKEIINSFNGTIELTKSDKIDFAGACFKIKLPLIK